MDKCYILENLTNLSSRQFGKLELMAHLMKF